MTDKPCFMIIGGDCRFSYIRNILEEKGFAAKRIYPGDYIADDFSNTDIFILPVPVTRDNININAPLSGDAFYIGDFIRLLPDGCTVAGGLISDELEEKLKRKGIKVFDYYSDEGLASANAIPTAEGILGILINSLPVTINGMQCAVTGYGKCARAAAKALIALGARVTVAARSKKSLDDASADGADTCLLSDFAEIAGSFSAVINTVPARVIDRRIIRRLKKDCLLIEIASAPFGIDFDCAKEYGINTIKAGSLPGRISPLTAGEIICNTILSYSGSDFYGD